MGLGYALDSDFAQCINNLEGVAQQPCTTDGRAKPILTTGGKAGVQGQLLLRQRHLRPIVRLTAKDAIKLVTLHTALMRTSVFLYHRHRFPAEIISHCVWLYFRFALSFRDVEEMLAMRGVILTYETVREWCLRPATKISAAFR